jgi:hypothetical protein
LVRKIGRIIKEVGVYLDPVYHDTIRDIEFDIVVSVSEIIKPKGCMPVPIAVYQLNSI